MLGILNWELTCYGFLFIYLFIYFQFFTLHCSNHLFLYQTKVMEFGWDHERMILGTEMEIS